MTYLTNVASKKGKIMNITSGAAEIFLAIVLGVLLIFPLFINPKKPEVKHSMQIYGNHSYVKFMQNEKVVSITHDPDCHCFNGLNNIEK